MNLKTKELYKSDTNLGRGSVLLQWRGVAIYTAVVYFSAYIRFMDGVVFAHTQWPEI